MTIADVLRFVMRAAHTGALAVWLGSSLFFLLSRSASRPTVSREVWTGAKSTLRLLVRPSFALLIASGAYLTFDRLAEPRLGVAYVAVLGVKLVLVAGIVWVLGAPGPRSGVDTATANTEDAVSTGRGGRRADRTWIALVLGGGALLLGVALTLIYEAELGRG